MSGTGRAYTFGAFFLDVAERRLLRSGEEIPLTPKAFETLRALVEKHGHALSKQELLETVWPDSIVEENNLLQNISTLRKILDPQDGSRYIATVPKYGYRFAMAVTEPSTAAPVPVSVTPPTRYARSGDLRIAYQVLGDGPVDLVFVMGWVSHLEYFWTEPSFARFLRRLASFSRLILFDKRGTGLSDRVPISHLPTLEERMDDVHAVLDAAGSSNAIICGVSEGGPMSALFAATYPEMTAALIMIGSYARRLRGAGYPWGVTDEEREQFIADIEANWGGPVGLDERAPSVAGDPRFRDWWATYLRMSASPGAAVAMTRMNGQIDIRHLLPSIRVPALVLHRAGDHCLKVEEGRYLGARIPGAKYVELPGVDHLPFVGDQDAILDEIEMFIANLRHNPDLDRVVATVLVMHPHEPPLPDQWALFEPQVRKQVDWFGGRSVAGGAAAFDGPARALRCACVVLERARHLNITLGVGLHTGECDRLANGDVDGLAVRITEGVARTAGRDELLVSSTVRDLVAGSPFAFDYRCSLTLTPELGEWRLFRVRRQDKQAAHG